jgi:hypothetical protein
MENKQLPYVMLYNTEQKITPAILHPIKQGHKIFIQKVSNQAYWFCCRSTEDGSLIKKDISPEELSTAPPSLAYLAFENKRCKRTEIIQWVAELIKMCGGDAAAQPIKEELTAERMAVIMARPILTEWEASQYINVSCTFLRADRMNGKLKNRTPGPEFIQFNSNIRYLRSELDKWLLAQQVLRNNK